MIKVTEREIFDILTGKISGAINRTVLKAFAREGINITTEQWSVLSCLWDKDKVIQTAICDLTQKDKPSVTRLIDKLEKKNLVKRASNPADLRTNLIVLTSRGTALKKKTTEVVHSIVNHVLGSIPDDELGQAKDVLQKIMYNLEHY
ncbi:MAG TPA: MarR family transcriptional regulator [Porphyromonadaceae bacterium]|jgi:DNA-binding MarR family transcriptional regulator|nr:MarR family transcriptional regulator [Porphyromonadaceae bacterium]HBK32073.1 MarR family transcriptional regulator [Porphyromonadaceae bacterium]HBL32883.1 MarR family transcriptional regulator [Porphyromonadaceae bacterium]HBX19520.1 MarR family transcriptional regulator [Porphyromonadaceae bacterium]HCM20687.1 MarR family transcriptional regulator [Porphyromonadaceae bacterium]